MSTTPRRRNTTGKQLGNTSGTSAMLADPTTGMAATGTNINTTFIYATCAIDKLKL